MDREGDVRVLENIVPNQRVAGHDAARVRATAVYSSKNLSPQRSPYALRVRAHTLSTEGVAMMFERNARQRRLAAWRWASRCPIPSGSARAAAKLRRNRLLVFSRWCQVMIRFERGLYANPDQDLNKLWWDLVEKYQELQRPEGRNEPDFAAKIPHRQRPGLLPQLHAGRDVRLAIAPRPGQGGGAAGREEGKAVRRVVGGQQAGR